MSVVLWFKRDLRVRDHAALRRAACLGPVTPLYIIEPDWWAEPDMSARQFHFLTECLDDLKCALEKLGLHLILRVGRATDVFQSLQAEIGFSHIISHEETGGGWTFARDLQVAQWARGNGVLWEEIAQSGVVRKLSGRDGWAGRRNAFLRETLAVADQVEAGPQLSSEPVPRLFEGDSCVSRQRGGRGAGLHLLARFLNERGQGYRKEMSSPLSAEQACSRLSPHLAWGTLSGREVAQQTAAHQRGVKGTRTGWGGALKSFQARLAWRDHFMQKLEDAPAIEYQCMHSAYAGMRGDDVARREAWEKGETGIPFVDACMRYLIATGWLNFRMRSMLMAVASYHLWLDWRQTGLHLARQFTDYEPGIHWPQVQMQSGTTGMNTIRIYNPVKQGRDQDPDGIFTRHWLPELRDVPDIYVQMPWLWQEAGQLNYPAPIVDVAKAAQAARDAVWAVRKGQAFRAEANAVIHKHASRKDSEGHFVNDRLPRRRINPRPQDDPRQKGFEF